MEIGFAAVVCRGAKLPTILIIGGTRSGPHKNV